MSLAPNKYRIDPVLTFLMLFVIAINLPYLTKEFMVGHDTKNVYATFHYFYNHLSCYNELPRWLPFGEYGYQTLFYQISNLSPSVYLVGLLGWLTGAANTLFLFKCSILVEQLILLLGLYLLGIRLYKDLWTVFIVSLLGTGSVIWYWQIYWDLRIFYLIPLVIYLYYRFLEDRASWCFWGALITLQFSFIGGLAYWAPVFALVFILMLLMLLPESRASYRQLLKPGWRDLILILVFILNCAALAYVLSTCLEGIHNYNAGRSMNEMRTQLSSYLTYASPPIWEQLHAFLDGLRPNTDYYQDMYTSIMQLPNHHYPDDMHLYIGLFPLVGLVATLFYGRSRWLCSLGVGAVAIFALAGAGAFSWLLYWIIPGMNMFRHLSLLLELGKILLLLVGGFGIKFLLQRIADKEWLAHKFRPIHLAILLTALFLIFDLVVAITIHKADSWTSPTVLSRMLPNGGWLISLRLTAWGTVLIALFAMSRRTELTSRKHSSLAKALLVFACLVDIISFQGFHWANRMTGAYAGMLPLEPMRFAWQRTSIPTDDAVEKDRVLHASPYGAFHAYYTNIMLFDPCTPYGFVDIFPKGVHELVTVRGATPDQKTIQSSLLPGNDPQLMRVMGCNAPKIRLVSQVVFGGNDAELNHLIRSNPALDAVAVLRGEPQQAAAVLWNDPEPMTSVVKFFNANKLDLEINVKPGRSGWLIYADSFNPHWKAFINGQELPVREAYMAFKAIAVPEGTSQISFRFKNDMQMFAMNWLMFGGICLAASTLTLLGYLLLKPVHRIQQTPITSEERSTL